MATVDIVIGVGIGFFLGVGAAIFYLRWKMKRQLGDLEQQMEGLMEVSEDMEEAFSPVEEDRGSENGE